MKNILQGLSFEDVLILPKQSKIRSRYNNKYLNTKTKIAKGLPAINRPIISSNMDTVTEAPMAIEMALHGCLGIIHRFMSPSNQADCVRLVKEKMRIIETNPPMVNEQATIQDALNLLEKRERGYVIVFSGKTFSGTFSGIVTTRDFLIAPKNYSIKKIMTPNRQGVLFTLPKETNLNQAVTFMKHHRIEKVPIVDKKGHLLGVYTLKDQFLREKHPIASLDKQGRLMVGAAIGVKDIDIERTHQLVEANIDLLVLDIAHGHLIYTKEMLHRLKNKENIKVPIIAGNIASKEGAQYINHCGGDGVKVGIGPGFVCETRDIAGVGVPQITAVQKVYESLSKEANPLPIIADGGIRKPGDIGKALVAGADAVMIGSLFAGTDQSPGRTVVVKGQLMKNVRGMASASAFEKRQRIGDTTTDKDRYTAEGRDIFTPYKGNVVNLITNLDGGLRSTMSYVGANTIKELKRKGELIKITPAGADEQKRPLS